MQAAKLCSNKILQFFTGVQAKIGCPVSRLQYGSSRSSSSVYISFTSTQLYTDFQLTQTMLQKCKHNDQHSKNIRNWKRNYTKTVGWQKVKIQNAGQ